MKKTRIYILCFFLVASNGAMLAAEETAGMRYVCRDVKGADRWRAEARIENVGPDSYLMTERGQGIYSSFRGRVSWVAEMKFERTENSVRPVSLDKRVYDASGRTIRRERQEFDLVNNTGVCIHEDFERNIFRKKKFTFDKNVITRLSLPFYAQNFLRGGKTSEKVQMVSEEPNVYTVELKRMGKDLLRVNGREIEACRLCVDPELGFFNFVKTFLPKSYGWYSPGPLYEWIGYAGLEGGVNSEKVEVFVEGL